MNCDVDSPNSQLVEAANRMVGDSDALRTLQASCGGEHAPNSQSQCEFVVQNNVVIILGLGHFRYSDLKVVTVVHTFL